MLLKNVYLHTLVGYLYILYIPQENIIEIFWILQNYHYKIPRKNIKQEYLPCISLTFNINIFPKIWFIPNFKCWDYIFLTSLHNVLSKTLLWLVPNIMKIFCVSWDFTCEWDSVYNCDKEVFASHQMVRKLNKNLTCWWQSGQRTGCSTWQYWTTCWESQAGICYRLTVRAVRILGCCNLCTTTIWK